MVRPPPSEGLVVCRAPGRLAESGRRRISRLALRRLPSAAVVRASRATYNTPSSYGLDDCSRSSSLSQCVRTMARGGGEPSMPGGNGQAARREKATHLDELVSTDVGQCHRVAGAPTPRRDAMSVSDKLTSASDKLAKLAERAEQAEEHAADARSKAKADVERSANEARSKAQVQAEKLRATANASEAHVPASWNDLQKQWTAHITKMREDIDAKKEQLDAKKAEIRAEDAEDDALFAIDYAYATIEEAEYAVLDAIVARMDADELAVG